MGTVMLVVVGAALLCLAGAVGGWWSARRALVLLDEARAAAQAARLDAQKAGRSAAAARRKVDAVCAGRLPLAAVFERWGIDGQRADELAREVADRVRRELTGDRVARGEGSRLEGHPVGASAPFRGIPPR